MFVVFLLIWKKHSIHRVATKAGMVGKAGNILQQPAIGETSTGLYNAVIG